MLAVKLYEKAVGKTLEPPKSYYFSDISGSRFKDYIQQAYDLKVVSGTGGNKFNPSGLVTRQEICAMIMNLLKAIDPDGNFSVSDDVKFKDDSGISGWARKAVVYAYKNNIMKGSADKSILPLDNTTREQAMTLIWNIATVRNYIH